MHVVKEHKFFQKYVKQKTLNSCDSVRNPFLTPVSANLKNQNPTVHAVYMVWADPKSVRKTTVESTLNRNVWENFRKCKNMSPLEKSGTQGLEWHRQFTALHKGQNCPCVPRTSQN